MCSLYLIETLSRIDQAWLLAINHWHAPWADTLMWYISQSSTWIPLYVVLVGLVIWRFGIAPRQRVDMRERIWGCIFILIGFGVAIGMSDFVSSGILKEQIGRLRPTHEPALEGMVHTVRGYKGGMYGFVSSHAANTMACALLFSLIWKKRVATIGLMLWVALNCYSRMYLGVHYPGDILGGLIVGGLMAMVVYVLLWRTATWYGKSLLVAAYDRTVVGVGGAVCED